MRAGSHVHPRPRRVARTVELPSSNSRPASGASRGACARCSSPPVFFPLRVHFGKNRFPFAVKERVRNVEDKMSRAPAASSIRPAGAVGADLQDACLGTVFSEALPAGRQTPPPTVGYYYYYSGWRQK
ncbi:hypothetical protein IscW_ISCW023552 [Ixodes scapularis]|uniref:Uncharacterized protein n=1 Tax=Ixodes scapularis TaxID=6945 RepID=B7QHX3_IXOSC|nr:hypothetical protein IscW_ISCW023552 [Ixodes scapularis]|eukprot:XP_002414780.1 hypothetical protein IscW_ISCW023552 [Ixodes scapularis]